MFIDKSLQVSSQQALTGTDPVASTDVIDLGSATRIVGPGEPLWWVIVARVGLAGTTPTLDIKQQTAAAANFATPIDLAAHPQLAAAAFATGTRLVLPLAFSNNRYLRLLYTLGGTTPTATVDAWLTNQDPTTWRGYPDGI